MHPPKDFQANGKLFADQKSQEQSNSLILIRLIFV